MSVFETVESVLAKRCFTTKKELLAVAEASFEETGYRSYRIFCLGGLTEDPTLKRWILLWADEIESMAPSNKIGGNNGN